MLVISLGLASRSLDNWLPDVVVANAGDFLWTIAAYLAIAVARPSWPPLRLGLTAFAISLAVELSQLSQADWLVALRHTLPGRLLLGSGFVAVDLVRYFAGACTAAGIDWLWQRRKNGVFRNAASAEHQD